MYLTADAVVCLWMYVSQYVSMHAFIYSALCMYARM